MSADTHHHDVHHRVWLPKNQGVVESWIKEKLERIEHPDNRNRQLSPVIQEFQDLIERDPEIYMAFHMMFEQIPNKPPYSVDPGHHQPQVRLGCVGWNLELTMFCRSAITKRYSGYSIF